jgi:hypothetical protein
MEDKSFLPRTEARPPSGGLAAEVLITLAVLAMIGGLILQASLYANVFDLLLARYLLLTGAILGAIGLVMWFWKRLP